MSKPAQELSKASFKNGAILGLFALISTGLIAFIHLLTKDKIAEEIEAAMARRLNQIVAPSEYNNDVYHDCKLLESSSLLGSSDPIKIYRMRHNQQNYGVFFTTTAPDGYAGKIKLLVGVYNNGTIAGVRVTEHQETPGLGDKIEIEKSNWIEQFKNLSLTNKDEKAWKVKKDGGEFDALTGATITPRAIIKAVHQSLIFFQQNKASLYDHTSSCGETK